MIQLTAVIIILTVAVALAVRHVWLTLKGKSDPCRGCVLAEKCTTKRKNRKNIWQCQEKALPLHPHSE